jgi:hypothetical protein
MAGPWEDYQQGTSPDAKIVPMDAPTAAKWMQQAPGSQPGLPSVTPAPWEDFAPVKEEGTLTKLARMPREAVEKIPYVGKAASMVVPDTPGQWGALAGLTAAGAIPGVGEAAAAAKIAPWLFRAGASALGATGGSLAGGERDPVEVAKEAGGAAAGQMLGEGVGKAIGAGAGYVGRQLKGGAQKLLDEYGSKLAEIIPGVGGQKFTPTRFFDVVMGGKGDKALGDAYQAGISEIQSKVGPNAFLQDPTITGIINKYLPKADYASNIGTMTQNITGQGATAPAHLILGGATSGNPISVDNAIKAAQEIGARARLAAAKPEGAILGREMRQANTELRQAIADNLNQAAPGAGDIYHQLNDSFRKGFTTLDMIKQNAEDIFKQGSTGPKIDAAALARAHNMAAAEMEKVGADELGAAARRGAPIGGGDTKIKIPGTGLFFGGSGVRGRLSESPIGMPNYAGQPNAGSAASPYVSGPIGQITINRLIEELKKLGEQGQ